MDRKEENEYKDEFHRTIGAHNATMQNGGQE